MKRDRIIYGIVMAYIVGLTIISIICQGNPTALKLMYIMELIVSALCLITIGIEDNKTLHVSWKITAIYLGLCIPGIVTGCLGGFMTGQLVFYLAGAAFAVVLIVYSIRTGRGGADRDICIISILAYPMIAVLSLVPALLTSIIVTARDGQRFPMLFPYAIVFGLLTLVQIVILF